jgi:hypothetical protein
MNVSLRYAANAAISASIFIVLVSIVITIVSFLALAPPLALTVN